MCLCNKNRQWHVTNWLSVSHVRHLLWRVSNWHWHMSHNDNDMSNWQWHETRWLQHMTFMLTCTQDTLTVTQWHMKYTDTCNTLTMTHHANGNLTHWLQHVTCTDCDTGHTLTVTWHTESDMWHTESDTRNSDSDTWHTNSDTWHTDSNSDTLTVTHDTLTAKCD